MTINKSDIITNVSKITGEPLKKRGRKSKKELMLIESHKKIENNIVFSIVDENSNGNLNTTDIHVDETETETEIIGYQEQKSGIKKRGRKPKGGKIIQQVIPLNNNKDVKPNVILHLKCFLKDIGNNKNVNFLNDYNNEKDNSVSSYNEYSYDYNCSINTTTNTNDVVYSDMNSYNEVNNYNETTNDTEQSVVVNGDTNSNAFYNKSNCIDTKETMKKIKLLEQQLHSNNINNKKSACFFCTCDFDNPPVYIPKHFIKESYEVYGCFCSPECATGYLMRENIDSSEKFERYHLLNYIYTKIYNYTKNIKPAPNPYYTLDKYFGNLTIQEYRGLLRSERLFLVVDKPLTRTLPELHEDNDDFIINNKIIPSNTYHIKKKLQQKQTKNNILNEKFGLQT
jgi:hypothetical protein